MFRGLVSSLLLLLGLVNSLLLLLGLVSSLLLLLGLVSSLLLLRGLAIPSSPRLFRRRDRKPLIGVLLLTSLELRPLIGVLLLFSFALDFPAGFIDTSVSSTGFAFFVDFWGLDSFFRL